MEEGCYNFQPVVEKLVRNGRVVLRDRRAWLPEAERQIGIGYDELGKERVVYFLRDGTFKLISKDIVSFLTIPAERVFETDQEEFFFCLLNRREWYLFLKDGVFYAKYSK